MQMVVVKLIGQSGYPNVEYWGLSCKTHATRKSRHAETPEMVSDIDASMQTAGL